jgi:uncharacterized protein
MQLELEGEFQKVMQINVAQLVKDAVGSTRHYEIDEVTADGLRVLGGLNLLRTNRSILVTGRLETVEAEVCSRCLEEFDQKLVLNIEEEYLLPRSAGQVSPGPPPGEPGIFSVDEDNILDLSEAIRQYALLSTPMKPVCRQDCAGLCTSCGSNLNQTECECRPDRSNSPWVKLQGLRTGE